MRVAEHDRAALVGDHEKISLAGEAEPSRWMRKEKASIVAPARASPLTKVSPRL